ncbi:MAG: hypothetical protein WKH64_19650, partial [Chloroflexia bacterium]
GGEHLQPEILRIRVHEPKGRSLAVTLQTALEYATFRRWRLYGEEALAGEEAAVSLQEKNLTLEYRGEPLSRYDVEYVRGTDRLEEIA